MTWLEDLEARGLLGLPVVWLPDGTLVLDQLRQPITEAQALAFRDVFAEHAAEAPFVLGPYFQGPPVAPEHPHVDPHGGGTREGTDLGRDAGTLSEGPPPLPPGGLEDVVTPPAPASGHTLYLPYVEPALPTAPSVLLQPPVRSCAEALRVILPYARAVIRSEPGRPRGPMLDAVEGLLRRIEAGEDMHGAAAAGMMK